MPRRRAGGGGGCEGRHLLQAAHVCIQLPNEAAEIVVLEALRQQVACEVGWLVHDETARTKLRSAQGHAVAPLSSGMTSQRQGLGQREPPWRQRVCSKNSHGTRKMQQRQSWKGTHEDSQG